MSQVREQARAALERLVLPVPQRERTLRLVVPKGVVPPYGIRCLCSVVAVKYWRTAHENGCTTVRVEDGTGHKHEFDTTELLQHIVRKKLGFIPRPKMVNGQVPRFLATRGHAALGDHIEEARALYAVPAAVSGTTPAAQED